MPALTSVEKLRETFSLALEERSKGGAYQDLVSNANAFFYTLKERGGWKEFSGPTLRERLLYAESGTYKRYAGYDFLNPTPAELFNDAEFEWKMAAVSVTLSGEEILKNSGRNQLKDIFSAKIKAAEQELVDRFTEDLHSAGTATNQIGGLQMALPTTVDSGVYGGISRVDNALWRTTTYDANSITVAGTAITAVTKDTIRPLLNHIMINRSRGTRGPNLFLMSGEHYQAYDGSLVGIQRINDENGLGKGGFTSLKYYGAGKSVDIVLEGGIGSAMPSNTTYFIDMDTMHFRYHPDRNFEKFGGKQTPINQDAVVQHIGFMGNLTMVNPLHNGKLYDSSV